MTTSSTAARDPAGFLRATPPFHQLAQELFDAAAAALEIGFYPAGTRLARAGQEPLAHLHVIRKGAVRLERDGQTIQLLEEGETFGSTSLLTRSATLDVVVEEDLLAYLIPSAVFQQLLADARFASHFAAGMAERLRSSLAHAPVATFQADLSLPVEELLRGPAIWVEADATIGEAAQVMAAERISSVLVRGETPGIVTDRDFRTRVLAKGRGPETPVDDVASRPLRSVAAATPVYDAWATLLDAGVHHLAVMRRNEIAGVVTATDLLRHTAQGPVAVLRGVERLPGRDRLPGYAAKVAEMASALLAGGLDVSVIAGLVARLNAALVRRILSWGEEELGPPPAPYAWLALGSEGRMEQTLLTDQDNALVYAEEGAQHREWYQALAYRANEDLTKAGFPRCPGGYMASRLHATRAEWQERFASWARESDPQGTLDAAIFVDFRAVAGALDVGPLDDAMIVAARPPFLRALAKSALGFRPPSALTRLRDTTTVDLKRGAIAPMATLARVYALEIGASARGTAQRIEAAARAGKIDAEAGGVLAETYRFLLELRLRHQLAALAAGRAPSDGVVLAELTGVQRSRLRDAFRAIRGWQERAAQHFQTNV